MQFSGFAAKVDLALKIVYLHLKDRKKYLLSAKPDLM